MSEDTSLSIETIGHPGEEFLIQPSKDRVTMNVGEGQSYSLQEFRQKLQDPDNSLWFKGEKRKLAEVEPKNALEALGLWSNGDLILAVKSGHTTKYKLPYYNLEQFGLGTKEELRKKIEENLTPFICTRIGAIEYIPEEIDVRGETYVDPRTGLILLRIYAHEDERWKSPEDKGHTLFHEIGHGVYTLLTPEEKLQWEKLVNENPQIKKLAGAIKDDREIEDSTEEAFTDTLASLATSDEDGKNNYRTNYSDLCQLMQKYVKI